MIVRNHADHKNPFCVHPITVGTVGPIVSTKYVAKEFGNEELDDE